MKKDILPGQNPGQNVTSTDNMPTERDFLTLEIRKDLRDTIKDLWLLSTQTEEGRDELVEDIKKMESSVRELEDKWLTRK